LKKKIYFVLNLERFNLENGVIFGIDRSLMNRWLKHGIAEKSREASKKELGKKGWNCLS
jgi:hypothetical protein